jgi:hypothetical protein
MAEMTIRLQTDPVTGRKNILVSLRSDEDLLPHEHEQQHRALVEKLIEGGVLSAAQVGKVIVEREAEKAAEEVQPASELPEQRAAQNEGA